MTELYFEPCYETCFQEQNSDVCDAKWCILFKTWFVYSSSDEFDFVKSNLHNFITSGLKALRVQVNIFWLPGRAINKSSMNCMKN